jgi:hypothetical protein
MYPDPDRILPFLQQAASGFRSSEMDRKLWHSIFTRVPVVAVPGFFYYHIKSWYGSGSRFDPYFATGWIRIRIRVQENTSIWIRNIGIFTSVAPVVPVFVLLYCDVSTRQLFIIFITFITL